LSSWHARRKDGSFAFLFVGEVGFLLPKTLSKTKKPSHRNTRLRLESPLVRRVEARFETRGAKSTDSKRPAISRSSPRGGASAASPSVACAPRATTLLAARARPPLSSPSSTMAIDFELSGLGPSAAEDISLEDIREAAVECGFTKPGVPASKTNAQRANLTTFFKTLGVTSLSGFKKRFHAEKLPCPYPDMTPLIMEKVRRACSRSRHEGGAYLNAASKASRLSRKPSSSPRRRHVVTLEEADAFPETKTSTPDTKKITNAGQTESGEDHLVRPRRLRVRRARVFVGG
jgi:hypothetical protein